MGLTPMMQQYLSTHEEVPDALLFFRLGDFYEMFFDDALTASRELELTLTGKDCGLEERAPMCGVPYHSADGYIAKLVEKGYKVAICEQMEDPALAKGIVKRGIVRVVSPGTMTESRFLEPDANNFLMSIFVEGGKAGCAVLDLSTGEFYASQDTGAEAFLCDQISLYDPAEVLMPATLFEDTRLLEKLKSRAAFTAQPFPTRWYGNKTAISRLLEQFSLPGLEAIGLDHYTAAARAAGAALHYVDSMQKQEAFHIKPVRFRAPDASMALDGATRRNLELTRTMRAHSKKGSLLGVLDRTVTAAGARLLRRAIESPLIDKTAIEARLDCTQELVTSPKLLDSLTQALKHMYDFERICTKIGYYTAVPADLIALRDSVSAFYALRDTILQSDRPCLKAQLENAPSLESLQALLVNAVNDEEQTGKKYELSYKIRRGYNAEYDGYRDAAENGQNWLRDLETRERERTGIPTLKVKYNKVFGYFIEVSNGKKDLVPDDYIRKQTLTNAERYFTPELKDIEDKITASREKLEALQATLYRGVLDALKTGIPEIQRVSDICAAVDMTASLALVAVEQQYTRPVLTDGYDLHIQAGRHPVVEQMTGRSRFISNDTALTQDARLMLITGPNMAGKSTYIRQTALIVLMAQIGSYVPAESAQIGITDRIFTRVGASDDLSTGQSTFMVEMTEVSNILRSATEKSLVILDEIGRGTSTFDGISIAWAVTEDLLSRKVKTLFATHYHELTEMENDLPGVVNYSIDVREMEDGVLFLRKIKRGAADQSYGIEVAKLAGFPKRVTDRAAQILTMLEKQALEPGAAAPAIKESDQISFFVPADKVSDRLSSYLDAIDPNELTPRQAQAALYDILERYGESK